MTLNLCLSAGSSSVSPLEVLQKRFERSFGSKASGYTLVPEKRGAVEPRELLFWSTKENDDDGF
jgi:hypothetical protein